MAGNIALREQKTRLNLERLRDKRGVSLETITEVTKISRRFLVAIEAEEFDKLPGGVFNVNYLRQYAAAVGFEETKLLAHYRAWSKQAEPQPEPDHRRSSWSRWFRTESPVGGSGI